MKVYVILNGDCEGANVEAVCSTETLARRISSEFIEIEVDQIMNNEGVGAKSD